jgi:hypothetical protein
MSESEAMSKGEESGWDAEALMREVVEALEEASACISNAPTVKPMSADDDVLMWDYSAGEICRTIRALLVRIALRDVATPK